MPGRRFMMCSALIVLTAGLSPGAAATAPLEATALTRTRKPPRDLEDMYLQIRKNGHAIFHGLEIRASRVVGRKLIRLTLQDVQNCGPVLHAKEAEFTVSLDRRHIRLSFEEARLICTNGSEWGYDCYTLKEEYPYPSKVETRLIWHLKLLLRNSTVP